MLCLKNRCSLTLVEFLITLCVVFILFGTFAIYAKDTLKVARERALQMELNNIRLSVVHYRIVKGELPENLVALMNQEFTYIDPDGIILYENFLRSSRVDEQENLLDPFLNSYSYSSRDGRVKSLTVGYESW